MDVQGIYRPVKRRLGKFTDLPFPAHHHPLHTGHDAAHRDDGPVAFHADDSILCLQEPGNGIPIFQGKQTGKINSHQVIFFRPEISRFTEVVIFRQILCFPDAP